MRCPPTIGVACRPATYGFPNVVALAQALGGELVSVKGRGVKRVLVLQPECKAPHSASTSSHG